MNEEEPKCRSIGNPTNPISLQSGVVDFKPLPSFPFVVSLSLYLFPPFPSPQVSFNPTVQEVVTRNSKRSFFVSVSLLPDKSQSGALILLSGFFFSFADDADFSSSFFQTLHCYNIASRTSTNVSLQLRCRLHRCALSARPYLPSAARHWLAGKNLIPSGGHNGRTASDARIWYFRKLTDSLFFLHLLFIPTLFLVSVNILLRHYINALD